MVRDIGFDKVHVAMYSTRPNTFAERKMTDDVPQEEKHRRLKAIEAAQETILTTINNTYLGSTEEVLVDGHSRGRLQGRTRTDKLVFFDAQPVTPDAYPVIPAQAGISPLLPPGDGIALGDIVSVRITRTTPWSLQGKARGVVPA